MDEWMNEWMIRLVHRKSLVFCDLKRLRNGLTDTQTDRQTDRQTPPLVDLRGRIKKDA